MKGLRWRIITVVGTTLFALYLLIPSVLKFGWGVQVPAALKPGDPFYFRLIPDEVLKLGLDLRGGLHLVLGIDFDEVNRDAVIKLKNQLEEFAEQEKIEGASFAVRNDDFIDVAYQNDAQWEAIEKVIADYMGPNIDFVSQTDKSATLKMTDLYAASVRSRAIDQSLETLRNRIDEFGIAEPIIQRQGEDKILVQFPGVQETGRLKEIISRTAKLSFQIVIAGPNKSDATPTYEELVQWVEEYKKTSGTEPEAGKPISEFLRAINDSLAQKLPKETEILFSKQVDVNTREASYLPYLLQREPMVLGSDIEDAFRTYDNSPTGNGDPIVSFQLNPSGAQKFEKATKENVGQQMAIVLDQNVHSAPTITERIPGGRAQISMNSRGRSRQEVDQDARDTALVLRSGALPAKLLFLEERVIGPSLGADAIRAGTSSLALGLVLVLGFMFVYYRGSGLVAVAALVLNSVFVLACLAAFEGTLTLPGLAGLTLTLGMAVDANVLIFEHIREELRGGKSVNHSIAEGYSRAFSAIFDGNLTTILAGIVLLSFGYGPIRGFAVTLLIGLVCSMYTAVFVTRVCYDFFVVSRNSQSLSI